MNKEELTKTRVQLYKVTPLKLKLVDELIELIKNNNDNITKINGVIIERITVKSIEIDPQEIGGVLIHWKPNFQLSTRRDPYCSAYILHTNSLKKIIRIIK